VVPPQTARRRPDRFRAVANSSRRPSTSAFSPAAASSAGRGAWLPVMRTRRCRPPPSPRQRSSAGRADQCPAPPLRLRSTKGCKDCNGRATRRSCTCPWQGAEPLPAAPPPCPRVEFVPAVCRTEPDARHRPYPSSMYSSSSRLRFDAALKATFPGALSAVPGTCADVAAAHESVGRLHIPLVVHGWRCRQFQSAGWNPDAESMSSVSRPEEAHGHSLPLTKS
jgi:hypothetical protein